MIKSHKENVLTAVEVVEDKFCNKCGRSLLNGQRDRANVPMFNDCLTIIKQWGYFSHKDNDTHKFDLCESCYDEFISGFVVPVEIEGMYW